MKSCNSATYAYVSSMLDSSKHIAVLDALRYVWCMFAILALCFFFEICLHNFCAFRYFGFYFLLMMVVAESDTLKLLLFLIA